MYVNLRECICHELILPKDAFLWNAKTGAPRFFYRERHSYRNVQRNPITSLPLQNMTIVVTGTLEHFKRTEIEEVIERHGGKASSSVSSKTTFVLVGAEPGSKLAKAQKLGVRIVHEAEFLSLIGMN